MRFMSYALEDVMKRYFKRYNIPVDRQEQEFNRLDQIYDTKSDNYKAFLIETDLLQDD